MSNTMKTAAAWVLSVAATGIGMTVLYIVVFS